MNGLEENREFKMQWVEWQTQFSKSLTKLKENSRDSSLSRLQKRIKRLSKRKEEEKKLLGEETGRLSKFWINNYKKRKN